MGNNVNSIKIKVSFEGEIRELIYPENITIKELIKQFVNLYLPKFKSKNFSLSINGKKCILDNTLETYKQDITSNNPFFLIYDYNEPKENDKMCNKICIKICDEICSDNCKESILCNKDSKDSLNDINECLRQSEVSGLGDSREEYDKMTIKKSKSMEHINSEYNFSESQDLDLSKNKNSDLEPEIDIKFFRNGKINDLKKNLDLDLQGLLKLCLLKEIAICEEFEEIEGLPEHISNIIKILKKGKIKYDDIKSGIKQILEKIKGGNILNFSNYVDSIINQKDINDYLIPKLKNSKNNIFSIQNCLGQYMTYYKKFEQEFDRAKKENVFEYSIISAGIIERDDIDKFEDCRKKCPNRVDRILFHGTCYDAISSILPDVFRISRYYAQHGEGVYFTEDLESCWIYGSEEKSKNNIDDDRRNLDVPKVGQYLSFIASAVYYDRKKKRRVFDDTYNPKENDINYAYAEMEDLETINEPEPDESRLYSSEFVVGCLEQILPFMCFKLKRDEYCIIWRDINFSKNPIYDNEFDEIFKNYLKERMEYINKFAKYNVYPCETSEEALKLIRRKKYNKIILISNIGTDLGGKTFVEEARKIIGNDVVVLFNAYDTDHLDWVKTFKNAFFSDEPEFYEQYLECFYDKTKEESKESIKTLKDKLEKHYNVKFTFDEKFLDYPFAENEKITKLKDLRF